MSKQRVLAHAAVWAAAIIASAGLGAPSALSLSLLPAFAAMSLLTMTPGASPNRSCLS